MINRHCGQTGSEKKREVVSKKFYIVIIAILAVLLVAAISIVVIVSSSEDLQSVDKTSHTAETSLSDTENTPSNKDKSTSEKEDSGSGIPDPSFNASGDLLEDLTGLIFTEDASGNLIAQAEVLSIDTEANKVTLSLQTGVDAREMAVTGKATYGNLSADKQEEIEKTIKVGSLVSVACQLDADSSSLALIDLVLI